MDIAPIEWTPITITGLSVAGVIVAVGLVALVLSLVRGSVRRPPELKPYRAYMALRRPGDVVSGRVVRVDDGWACVVLERRVVGFIHRPTAAPGDVIEAHLGAICARPTRIQLT